MRLFGIGLRHHILEVPRIPSNKNDLRTIIGEARAQRRKRNLTRWAALNLVAWGGYLLVFLPGANAEPSAAVALELFTVYLPVVAR
jgi:hypothetical protein